jgi:hypothetical protein
MSSPKSSAPQPIPAALVGRESPPKIIGWSAAMHDTMKGERIARGIFRPNVRERRRCENPKRVALSDRRCESTSGGESRAEAERHSGAPAGSATCR